ncbi:hybrid cluster protein-associated redox disulfide domain-containing protein [Natronincola peptidivorans]|uniref:Hybrid cluster protein-associated redox disulfide domain-containing protein n=1 Tax=Natronincola peptidivorans TaxID=426128 RepID=A0A1I0D863_9FIRM|nr:DUF1858 domain-containing protein [Natronincola peptidivorans]SET28249.1 hybrid cluster protein-associated redox disulfide domain-containing protein [Natronincola peptidivorans]
MKITKDTLISDVLKINPNAVSILMSYGMGCLGCPSSQMETVGQAAAVHGIDADALLEKLNA